jgi:hypothetical protein
MVAKIEKTAAIIGAATGIRLQKIIGFDLRWNEARLP